MLRSVAMTMVLVVMVGHPVVATADPPALVDPWAPPPRTVSSVYLETTALVAYGTRPWTATGYDYGAGMAAGWSYRPADVIHLRLGAAVDAMSRDTGGGTGSIGLEAAVDWPIGGARLGPRGAIATDGGLVGMIGLRGRYGPIAVGVDARFGSARGFEPEGARQIVIGIGVEGRSARWIATSAGIVGVLGLIGALVFVAGASG